MSHYLKLDHRPTLAVQYPQCGTCCVDLEVDPDSMRCPMCGTTWSTSANDGEEGDLYEEWAELPGPELDEDGAFAEAARRERAERDTLVAEILARPAGGGRS
jgi:hypothetical protein